jgi:O-antigen ligase
MAHAQADRHVYFGLLVLLFWAPLPFGSNRPWGGALLFLGTALLLTCWLLLFAFERVRISRSLWQQLRWPVLLLLGVQCWVLLQTIPLPRGWVESWSPRAATLHLPGERIPLTLDSALTRFHLLLGLSYTAVFALVPLLANSRSRINGLLWTLTLSGAFQAIYGALMTLSGLEYGFFVEKYSGEGVATGTFINRNHLAGYLVMTLSAGIGLLITRLGTTKADTARERIRGLLQLLLSTKFLLRLLLATMVVGLVLTRSRMGNLAFFVSLTVAGAAVLLGSRRTVSRNLALLFASLLLVDMLIVGQWFGADQVAQRLMETTASSESRDEVSVLSLGIIRDFPWTGSGAGTFYTVFPHYSEVVLQGDYYVHAHNDYVELAGDLGLPVFAFLAVLVFWCFARGITLQYQCDSRYDRGLGFCIIMTVVWALLHSTADFNLYVSANSLTFTAILAFAWLERTENRRNSQHLA